jgi:regulator of sigma E protease
MELFNSLLYFILAIGILVTVHEFGHFWVARRVGVRVLRFSIGFGQPLWRRVAADGVEYVVAMIPFGGYVKMLDEREGEVDPAEAHRAFNRQGKAARAAIAVAGPALNYLFAVLAYWLVFTLGDDGMRPVLGQVAPDSVAARAGFGYGDEILRIGGREVASWEQALYVLLGAAVDEATVPVEVRTEQGGRHDLQLPGPALGEMIGKDQDLFEQLGVEPQRLPALIGELVAGEAAEQAGLRVGDRVLAVDGQPVRGWSDWVEQIHALPDGRMALRIERAGAELSLDLRLGSTEREGRRIGRLGAAVQIPPGYFERMRTRVRYEPVEAMGLALEKTADLSLLTLKVIWKMLTGNASVHNLSGPITIARTAGKSASYGLVQFIKFLALVSVSLAVLNLLPIPVLDGGHLFFILIEAIRGRPLSDVALEQGQRLGMALLLSLMVLAFYVDIVRLIK